MRSFIPLMLTALLFTTFGTSAQNSLQSISTPSVAIQTDDTATYPYWAEMMLDPDVNFYAVQSAFKKYWTGRTITKGCGWKVYKRWEYSVRNRLNPDGTLMPAEKVFKELQTNIHYTKRK